MSEDVGVLRFRNQSRDAVKRVVFRRHLRKLFRLETEKKNKDSIRSILNDEDQFEMLFQAFVVDQYNVLEDSETPILDAIKEFISFLIENREGLIELIKGIIDLFTGIGLAV